MTATTCCIANSDSAGVPDAPGVQTLPGGAGARWADEAGFDISLVEESLGYSHEKRLLQHQAAPDLVLEMERAGHCVRELNRLLLRRR